MNEDPRGGNECLIMCACWH